MKKIEDLIKSIPAPPENLKKSPCDLVSWSMSKGKGLEPIASLGAACYAPIMSTLGQQDMECLPYARISSVYNGIKPEDAGPLAGRLSRTQYVRIMNSLREAGISPPGVQYYSDEKKGNCLFIPAEVADRHTIYMLLNLYRIIDSRPDGAWQLMALQDLLVENGHSLSFLQVLFYVINEGGNTNHSFYVGHYTPLSGAYGSAPLFQRAWAFSRFYNASLEERRKLVSKAGQTHIAFKKLGEQPEVPKIDILPIQLLSPKMSPVFTHPDKLTKSELKALEAL